MLEDNMFDSPAPNTSTFSKPGRTAMAAPRIAASTPAIEATRRSQSQPIVSPHLSAYTDGFQRQPGLTCNQPDANSRFPLDLEVIIPAFNESGRLPATLRAMVQFLSRQPWTSRVVVVDNGSYDDTTAAAMSVSNGPVEVVAIACSHPGKGAALRRGLGTSRSRIVGFTDADLSTPLETMLLAIAAIEHGGASAAIASRYTHGARVAIPQPLARRLGGHFFRALARPLLPDVRDTQCGFKFFDRPAVMTALSRCHSSGFAFDAELLRRIRDDGGKIIEIPVIWTNDEQSSLRPIRDGVATTIALLQLYRSYRPIRHDRVGPSRNQPELGAASAPARRNMPYTQIDRSRGRSAC
jgi:dolichyl-phosphate beta-glucosyltransferase